MAARANDPAEASKELTLQIRIAMLRRGVSQKEISERTGVTQQTVSLWVCHPERMTLQNWAALNSILRLDPGPFNQAAGFVRGGAK